MEIENDERRAHECGSKKRYLSRKEARVARNRYQLRFGDRMTTYPCSFCGAFHVGHKLGAKKSEN